MCDVPVCEDPSTFDALNDHSEILSDSNDDGTSSDDNDFEDIEYVSLEEVNDVDQEVKEFDLEDILQIQDVILREKLLNVKRIITNIKSLNDNPTPDRVLKSPSSVLISVTDSNSLFEKAKRSRLSRRTKNDRVNYELDAKQGLVRNLKSSCMYGYQEKDKNKDKTDKDEHGNGKSTRKRVHRSELEDFDVDEVSGSVKDSDKCNADGGLDKKKKKRCSLFKLGGSQCDIKSCIYIGSCSDLVFLFGTVMFSATILQISSAIRHINNIDNMYIKSYSFSLFSSLPGVLTPVRGESLKILNGFDVSLPVSHSLWSSQSFGHQKAINGFDMPLPVAVCSGLVNPLAPRKGKFHGGLITMSTLCT
ncbi:hypothetical protein Tco_1132309 [Tanacetum coccineum]|uniref:Uncharacterized protein n=1 Tax=Tanacetum coccineum TaxID=301880 RepID=A0ABQ5JEH4_9ASTR